MNEEGITASVGWCSPSPVVYTVGWMQPDYTPPAELPLPVFQASKGGISFKFDNFTNAKQDRFLAIAMGVALTSKSRMKHGAIIVRHSKVISVATNTFRNNPQYVDWKHSSFHAEVNAIKKVKNLKKSDIMYVARVSSTGSKLSKPCDSCMSLINSLGIKVVWTNGTESWKSKKP